MVGLILSTHSRPLSHYCPIRGLLAAGFPPWPGAPLLSRPASPRLLRGIHINTRLSVDVQSTWATQHQNPRPQTILRFRPPSSRITGDATLPVERVVEIIVRNNVCYGSFKTKQKIWINNSTFYILYIFFHSNILKIYYLIMIFDKKYKSLCSAT